MTTISNVNIETLYAITPTTWDETHHLKQLEYWLQKGLRMVQYRAKQLPFAVMQTQAKAIKALCDQYQAKLIINDSIALMHAVDASGVHLGQSDCQSLPHKKHLRETVGNDKIIGITCHSSLALCHEALQAGADYVSLGACFVSATKPEAKKLDWRALQDAQQQKIPVCVIGGINESNINQLLPFFPRWIAACSMFFDG